MHQRTRNPQTVGFSDDEKINVGIFIRDVL
jgi:hypothetical protein